MGEIPFEEQVAITRRERYVLDRRFMPGVFMTYSQIAEQVKLTPRRVKELRDSGLKKIVREYLVRTNPHKDTPTIPTDYFKDDK